MSATAPRSQQAPLAPISVQRVWSEIVEPVRPFLDRVSSTLSAQIQSFDPEIAPYARYALSNQGKQIRPTLVALSGGAVSDSADDSLCTAAVIIEMVHLATLVHDDVMDEAHVRRNKPT